MTTPITAPNATSAKGTLTVTAGTGGGFPSGIAGLVARYDASNAASITASAGAVSAWADLSGNGYHVTQGTGANQPTTGVNSQNGLNVLTFASGSEKRLARTTTPTWTTTPTIAIVCSVLLDGTQTQQMLMSPSSSKYDGPGRGLGSTTDSQIWVAGGSLVWNPGAGVMPHGIHFVKWGGGGTADYRYNLVSKATASLTAGGTATGITFGVFPGDTYDAGILIAEAVLYSVALGNSDRDTLEAYLKTKWNTP